MFWNQNGANHANTAGVEHIDGLYSYALVLTRNHEEAEGLVQETYVRAIHAVSRLRPDSNIKGWLFTILRNVWLNQLRKRRSGHQFADVNVEAAADLTALTKNSHDLYLRHQAGEGAGAGSAPTTPVRISRNHFTEGRRRALLSGNRYRFGLSCGNGDVAPRKSAHNAEKTLFNVKQSRSIERERNKMNDCN
jgi:RNA polymerase sigma factor (sigma-70 family)